MSMALVASALVGLGSTLPPSSALRPVPFSAVRFEGGFWGERLDAIRAGTLPRNFEACDETGRIANLRHAGDAVEHARTAGQPVLEVLSAAPAGGFKGFYFDDSDVYKMIEGACYQLALEPDADLRARTDAVVEQIRRAQLPDGYVNSHFVLTGLDKRWTNTPVMHEMYCIGHLIEAGVAHHAATGERTLLDVAVRAADLLVETFGPGKRPDLPGHQEVELALIKLSRATGDRRYLDLARHFVETRGVAGEGRTLYGEYCQDVLPIREHTEVVGHAVRAMYYYAAATDLCLDRRDPEMEAALERVWTDLTERKMYVTGGIGNSAHNEGFTKAYDLPNDTAYAETCAGIGLAMWAHRLALLHADARYFDTFERILYNGALSGVSLDGRSFFYENPLSGRGDHHRLPWYPCACCPPNIARFFSSLGGYACASGPRVAVVNLYANGRATFDLSETGGGPVAATITQQTDYPWSGRVRMTVTPSSRGSGGGEDRFEVRLRIPGWCAGQPVALKVNGASEPLRVERGYATITRAWKKGDTIDLVLPMAVRRVRATPRLTHDLGRVALQRGPIVYALEQADNPAGVRRLVLPAEAEVSTTPLSAFTDRISGGIALRGRGVLAGAAADESVLYSFDEPGRAVDFTAIPYFAWDNREPGELTVWIAESASVLPPSPQAGVTPSASHCWQGDTILALCDRLEPSSSADHSIPRLTWWSRKGTEEWAELAFESPRRLTGVEVYWFDDSSLRGGCRLPESWSVEVRDAAGDWKPARAQGDYPVAADTFCRAAFEPVEATGLRVRAKLQENFSGGILEIRCVR